MLAFKRYERVLYLEKGVKCMIINADKDDKKDEIECIKVDNNKISLAARIFIDKLLTILLRVIYIAGLVLLGIVICSTYNHFKDKSAAEINEKAVDNRLNYIYPQSKDDEGISVSYTEKVLKKKSLGEDMTKDEDELITNFILKNNGYGIAHAKWIENDGGMHHYTERVFETADGGKNWNVLREEYKLVAPRSYAYIGNVYIESMFNPMNDTGSFFVSVNRGHSFNEIPYTNIFTYDKPVFAEKIDESESEETITYQWIDQMSGDKDVVAICKYDLKLNLISEKRIK